MAHQADFSRNGTAKGIMSLSKSDSTALWHSVQTRTIPGTSIFPPQLTEKFRRPHGIQLDTPKTPKSPRQQPSLHTLEDLSTFLALRESPRLADIRHR